MHVKGREARLLFSILALLLLLVFLIEPRVFSFERGAHFNWVPIHSLAITSHSNWSSGFVGFSCRLSDFSKDAKETFIYEYFNRYPIFFAVASNLLLSLLGKTTAAYLLVSKQLMNAIFVLTLGFLYLSLRELRLSRIASALGVLAIAASPLWLNYRPMYHFDQPGLLGYCICLYGYSAWIRGARLDGRSPHHLRFLLVAIAGALLGRSFITPMFLGATALMAFLKGAPRKDKFYLLLAALFTSASIVTAAVYASAVESIMNRSADRSSVASVAVFQSAQRRLGLPSATWPDAQKSDLAWSSAIKELTESVANLLPSLPFLLLGLIGLWLLIRPFRPSADLRASQAGGLETRSQALPLDVWLATFLASLGWLVLFKNLIVFHDYTVIFLVPWLALTAGILIEAFLATPADWGLGARARQAMAISMVVIVTSCFLSGYVDSIQAWRVSTANRAKL
ncbi:MAG TPA: hypothetical protein VER57_03840, partial [Cyanobium sp.]|nr:hypothetical protein [Cyanobium sp.]